MKRTILTVLIMSMTIAAVASVMMRPARAQTIRVFTAALLTSNEVAPVAAHPTEAGGSGSAIVTIDTAANTARFDVTMSGFPSTSNIILSHIHQAGATANGPVVIDSGITPATPVPLTGGGAAYTRPLPPATGISASATIIQGIIANPSGFYFNVHTALSPSGVARGQLTPQQVTGLTVPTLSEWGAIVMFLLLGAAATFFVLGGRKPVLALAQGQSGEIFAPAPSVDWKLLARMAMYVEVIVGLGLVALRSSVTTLDVGGALLSGLIVAFIIHLMVSAKRR